MDPTLTQPTFAMDVNLPWQPDPELELEHEYAGDPSAFQMLSGEYTPRLQAQGAPHKQLPQDYGQSFVGAHHSFSFIDPQSQVYKADYPSFYAENSGRHAVNVDATPHTAQSLYPQSGMAYARPGPSSHSPSYYSPETQTRYLYGGMESDQRLGPSHSGAASLGMAPPTGSYMGDQGVNQQYVASLQQLPSDYGSSPEPQPGTSYGGPSSGYAPDMHHTAKRLRINDDSDAEEGYDDAEVNSEPGTHAKDENKKLKPTGACARCKGLKVKCEFKTHPDICRRCLNGGHECVIPGRKKRRAPPKRDLLLSQIREQAAKIEALMKQLEDANLRAERVKASSSSTDFPSITSNASDLSGESDEPVTKPDVLDWIAKARESIQAFGGYINMGGAAATDDLVGIGHDSLGPPREPEDGSATNSDEDEDPLNGDHNEFVSVEEVDVDTTKLPTKSSATSLDAHKDGSHRGRKRLAILPNAVTPMGMMANLSLKSTHGRGSSRSRSVGTQGSRDIGVASEDYWRAGPQPDPTTIYANHQTPHILRNGLVSPQEVELLFKIYFDYINLSTVVLDPALYSAQKMYWRSPFLFTVICAVASRYYQARPNLYEQAMNFARLAAGTTLIGGQKSVETVNAYILLSLYPLPTRRWEEDRCWMYLGLAIRVANDLNLHHVNVGKPRNEQHEREMLNRTRTWLSCFNWDRILSSQSGKYPIIHHSDYLASHAEAWCHSSPLNLPGHDEYLCSLSPELMALAHHRAVLFCDPEHPVLLNKRVDFVQEGCRAEDELIQCWKAWEPRMEDGAQKSAQRAFQLSLRKLIHTYGRLAVLSFVFNQTFEAVSELEVNTLCAEILWRALRIATQFVRVLLDEAGSPEQRVYLRHAPESAFVFTGFICGFLTKLLQPRYLNYVPRQTRIEIREMAEQAVELLSAPDIAIDDRHAPKLYARFISGLLEDTVSQIDHPSAALKRPNMRPLPAFPNYVGPRSVASTLQYQSVIGPLAAKSNSTQDGSVHEWRSPSQACPSTNPYAANTGVEQTMAQPVEPFADYSWSDLMVPGFSWPVGSQSEGDVGMGYPARSGT